MRKKKNLDSSYQSSPFTTDRSHLYRAPWVVTVSTDSIATPHPLNQSSLHHVIEDGGVLTNSGRILAVGRFRDLIKEYTSSTVTDYEECILTPALVNAHTHLELSYLAELGREKLPVSGLPSWIRNLISKKEHGTETESEIITAGRQALELMCQNGIGLVGDVANMPQSRLIAEGSHVVVFLFLELLGMSAEAEKKALTQLNREDQVDANYTVHAPYSSSPNLIRQVKKHALLRQQIFSIHVAESLEELEFLQYCTGDLKELLVERGWWDESFSQFELGNKGPIHYLDRLGVLDDTTLCVHVVHVTSEEISLLAQRRVKVCLCPGSNRHLRVGKAPVDAFIANGILPALGTDSLASNSDLDLWQEMQIVREEHPYLNPEIVFAMATKGGAEALGYAEEMGSIAPGKRAYFLAVQTQAQATEDIMEYLTSIGKSVKLSSIIQ